MMLRLEDVSLSLGDFQLRSLSLQIGKPEYWVVIGPSGSSRRARP